MRRRGKKERSEGRKEERKGSKGRETKEEKVKGLERGKGDRTTRQLRANLFLSFLCTV